MPNIFYVYEHWRPDTDVCFWVGKGKGNRAFDFRRNFHYNNIVKKLSALGMCVEVRMVSSGMPENAALSLERGRIAFWRENGVALANYTDGGEGVSGLRHSEETREKIKAKRALQKVAHTAETRAKISAANKLSHPKGGKNPAHGDRIRGRKHSLEHCAKISVSNLCRIVSVETRVKISMALKGKKTSELTRSRLVTSHQGKKASAKTRAKMSASGKKRWAKEKEKCPQF